jgi:DNA-binding transcriptional regulator YiaG
MTLKLNPVDRHVGSRIREVRERLQYTQAFLAAQVGTTVEQIERFESLSGKLSLWKHCPLSIFAHVALKA